MITLILHVFAVTGRQWKIGDKRVSPTHNHIKGALDEAAKMLYAEKVGVTLQTGGLFIEKTKKGYDVYVHVGSYS